MNYWKEMYGVRETDFIEGVIAGITAFAWWKNGVEYVGTSGKTRKVAIQEAVSELSNKKLEYKDNQLTRTEE